METQKATEEKLLADAQATQRAMEIQYTEFFKQQISIRWAELDRLIAKLRTAQSLWGFSGTSSVNSIVPKIWTSTSTSTSNVSNNITVNWNVRNEADINKLAKQVVNEITRWSKNIK